MLTTVEESNEMLRTKVILLSVESVEKGFHGLLFFHHQKKYNYRCVEKWLSTSYLLPPMSVRTFIITYEVQNDFLFFSLDFRGLREAMIEPQKIRFESISQKTRVKAMLE